MVKNSERLGRIDTNPFDVEDWFCKITEIFLGASPNVRASALRICSSVLATRWAWTSKPIGKMTRKFCVFTCCHFNHVGLLSKTICPLTLKGTHKHIKSMTWRKPFIWYHFTKWKMKLPFVKSNYLLFFNNDLFNFHGTGLKKTEGSISEVSTGIWRRLTK